MCILMSRAAKHDALLDVAAQQRVILAQIPIRASVASRPMARLTLSKVVRINYMRIYRDHARNAICLVQCTGTR